MNWINFIVYGGIVLISVIFWYVFVFHIMDWIAEWFK